MNYELAQAALSLAVTPQHHAGLLSRDVSAVCIIVNETLALIYQYFLRFKILHDDEALQQNLL